MPAPALRNTIALALAAVTTIHLWQQHNHAEVQHRHQFSRDHPRLRARPKPEAAPKEDEAPATAATLELVCAGSGDRGRSLYCQAGGEARCGADATVPLHLRAWTREAVEGKSTLTIDGHDGERKRLSVRDDGRLVCVFADPFGVDFWKFLRRGGRAGLVHERRGRVRVLDGLDFEGQQGVLVARRSHPPRAPFEPRHVDAAHVARSRAEAAITKGEDERHDAEQRLELKRRFATKKRERRVIAMALYGSDPKYVEGCLENARLVEAYFPSWTLRVYADVSSVPPHKLKELEALNVEIHRDDWSAQGTSWGMFRRFFVADDTNVDRFIVRDSDSRLNPRDAFAVADWVDSAYAVHTLRDHPNHQRLLNGGMWGATRHSNIAGKIETLARQYWDHDAYGADLEFLAADVAPLVAREVLAHDSYSCELFGGSRPFPTRRPADFQHVGQVFDGNGRTRGDDIDSFTRGVAVPEACRGRAEWVFG